MKILSIHIKELFEIFNYDIIFPQSENVLIITGPNGFGKTMILNIIFNLFNKKLSFFQKLSFSDILLKLEGNISIEIQKKQHNDRKIVSFEFIKNGKTIGNSMHIDWEDKNLLKLIEELTPLHQISPDTWFDHRSGETLKFDDLQQYIQDNSDQLPKQIIDDILDIGNKPVNDILTSIKVHIIKEQRLFKKVPNLAFGRRNMLENRDQSVMIDTIPIYADELKKTIKTFSDKAYIKTQELDSSYPSRLRAEKEKFDQPTYEQRYAIVKAKQEKLTRFGLYELKQAILDYSDEDAKALTVYLKDLELKLNTFDDLLEKLEIFTNVLNERRFTFKTIQISPDKGFFFKTSKGQELKLDQLSSGEQHEVVLLYELIFNVDENVLVLIDEPEISLHVTWQKDFLNDLLSITNLQNIQVIVATHSPAIINSRWDLTYNLEKSDEK